MSSHSARRKVNLPGRLQREQLNAGRQPRSEKEVAYVENRMERLRQLRDTESREIRRRSPSRERYRSRSPHRARESRRRSPSRGKYRTSPSQDRFSTRTPPRTRTSRARSRSLIYDEHRLRTRDNAEDSPSREKFPKRTAPYVYRPSQSETQSKRISSPTRRLASVPQGNTAISASLTEEERSTKMEPPLHKPEKPSAEQNRSPITPAAQQGKGATYLPTPVTPSAPLQQQLDPNFDVVFEDDTEDVEDGEDEFGTEATDNANWPYDLNFAADDAVTETHATEKVLELYEEMSPMTRAAIIEAIQSAPGNDKLAGYIRPLLRDVLEAGTYIQTTEYWTLYVHDVLSLYYLKGQEEATWYTENVIHSVLDLEAPYVSNVYVACHLDVFLSEDYDRMLESELLLAVDGKIPTVGWSLSEVLSTHTRMVAAINPSKNHWIAIEFVRATTTERAKLFYYNSLSSSNGRQKGRSHVVATQILPKILYLANFQPGYSLEGFDGSQMDISEVPCPQQHGAFDCGPIAIYCTIKRLLDQSVDVYLPTPTMRARFGLWMREICAHMLCNNHNNEAEQTTLREAFEARRLCEERVKEFEQLQAEPEDFLDSHDAERLLSDETAQIQLARFLADVHKMGIQPPALALQLMNRTHAPSKYRDLLALWDRQQQMKNAQSELHAPRNQRPQ